MTSPAEPDRSAFSPRPGRPGRGRLLVVAAVFIGVSLGAGLAAWNATAAPVCGQGLWQRVIDRGGVTPNDTSSFTPVAGPSLDIDVYQPANPKATEGTVIFVHGGAWSGGSRAFDRTSAPLALCRRGYAIASIDYRLTSEGATWPEPGVDVLAAVDFIARGGLGDDVDRDRLAIWGDSAGGHLASFAAVAGNEPGETGAGADTTSAGPAPASPIRAVVTGAGIFDFTDPELAGWAENTDAPGEYCTDHPGDARCFSGIAATWPCTTATDSATACTNIIEGAILRLLGCEAATVRACGSVAEQPMARAASPIALVDSCDPPHLLVHDDTQPSSTADGGVVGNVIVPPSQKLAMTRALDAAGVETSFSRWSTGSGHAAIGTDAASLDPIDEFLLASLTRPTSCN